jgi:CRP-like cAMP-binding protein
VARLQDGDIVGEMALITGEPRSAHVDTETDMQLWCLTKAQFDELSEAYPDLRSFLTDLVTQWFETRTVTAERKIAKYILTDIIGKGSYSIVYRGVHQALNMSVAIKMMKHDMAMENDFIKNFRNEAKTIAKFNHENIVKVYDIEERYQLNDTET